jgi:hypothetical protein
MTHSPGESSVPFRVIVTGSRGWPKDYEHVIWHELDGVWLRFAARDRDLPGRITIVHGQCPYGGVDKFADNWAQYHSQVWERHPAEEVGGRILGPERNTKMVSLGASLCIGFPMKGSRGTWDCVKKAVDADIDTYTVAWSTASAGAWNLERTKLNH